MEGSAQRKEELARQETFCIAAPGAFGTSGYCTALASPADRHACAVPYPMSNGVPTPDWLQSGSPHMPGPQATEAMPIPAARDTPSEGSVPARGPTGAMRQMQDQQRL